MVCLLLLLTGKALAQSVGPNASEASKYVGKIVDITGYVIKVYRLSHSGSIAIDLGDDINQPVVLTLIIAPSKHATISFYKDLQGHSIELTAARVSEYKGHFILRPAKDMEIIRAIDQY